MCPHEPESACALKTLPMMGYLGKWIYQHPSGLTLGISLDLENTWDTLVGGKLAQSQCHISTKGRLGQQRGISLRGPPCGVHVEVIGSSEKSPATLVPHMVQYN